MSKAKFLGIPEGGKRAGWMEMEGGGSAGVGAFVVNLGMDASSGTPTIVADKTYDEIVAAAETGKVVIAVMSGVVGRLIYGLVGIATDTNTATFTRCFVSDGSFLCEEMLIYKSGTVTARSGKITLPTT